MRRRQDGPLERRALQHQLNSRDENDEERWNQRLYKEQELPRSLFFILQALSRSSTNLLSRSSFSLQFSSTAQPNPSRWSPSLPLLPPWPPLPPLKPLLSASLLLSATARSASASPAEELPARTDASSPTEHGLSTRPNAPSSMLKELAN